MKRIVLLVYVTLAATSASAFPQMVAHGYASCTACHVAPAGGGILSPYGRSLSRELVSSWGYEGEEAPLYGVVPTPDWLLLGGDARWMQLVMRSPFVDMARFFLMQADVEAVAVVGRLTFGGTLGHQSEFSRNDTGTRFFSRRYYAQWQATDQDYLRVGKFEAAYGIRWPDHANFTRRDLGWDEGSEAYRAEMSHLSERWEAIVSGSLGRLDAPKVNTERGVTVRAARYLGEGSQVAFSVHWGSKPNGERLLFGPSASLKLLESAMLFLEVDVQKLLGGTRGLEWGLVTSARANYELVKGLHLFAIRESAKLALSLPTGQKTAYGLGVQWFPRPHFEFAAGLRRQLSSIAGTGAIDTATLLLHYYL